MLQGSVSWIPGGGWAIVASGGTALREHDRLAVAMAQVSYAWQLSPGTQMQAGVAYYDHPGRAGSPSYHPAEVDLTWIYRNLLVLNVSALRPSGVGRSRVCEAVDINLRWPLAEHLSAAVGLGVAQFPQFYGYDAERLRQYGYGNLGLVWDHGPWRLELDRVAASGAMRRQRPTEELSPWLVTAMWSF